MQTAVIHRVPGSDVDLLLSGTTTLMSGHLPPGGADAIRQAMTAGAVRRRALLVGSGALAASGILGTMLPFAAAALSFSRLGFDDGYATEEFDASDVASASKSGYPLSGSWTAGRISTGFRNSGSDPLTVQVVLHATSGTAYDDDTGSQAIGSGSGAYIVATVSLPANSPVLYFSLRNGARGNNNRLTGHGGVAVGAYLWDGGVAESTEWFAVAGAGGGDGAAGPGGRWGQNGGGADAGLAAVGGTAGIGGTGTRTDFGADNPTGVGYDAISGSPLLGRGATDPGSAPPSKIAYFPSISASGGGGGGAGWASGGGGGTNSGGGGGSSYLRTSGGGPIVTSHVIYSVPRDYSSDGTTARFELYTP